MVNLDGDMSEIATARPVPFVTRIRLTDFRSIASCDVSLGPLTVLLGFNASGKSNFLDALNFLAEALETSPYRAIADRGGLDALLRRTPTGAADSFTIELDLSLPPSEIGSNPFTATYAVEISQSRYKARPRLGLRERCVVRP